jgi:uncharacterized protein (DUF58 family)
VSRLRSGALGLGGLVLAASWLLGSVPLAVAGLGLALAGAWARVWSRRAGSGLVVERPTAADRAVEGEDVVLELAVSRRSRLPVGSAVLSLDVQRLLTADVPIRTGCARIVLEHVPRGRYEIGQASVSLTDPLGLGRVAIHAPAGRPLVVEPRIVELTAMFSDAGARRDGGARARLRRPGGFELHAVREYQPGEPLRTVHWPSTARRAELMVKELDDVPRDDVVVLLDQNPIGCVGDRGSSSLDAAVRACGSLARAHAGRGRRVAVQLTGGAGTVVRLHSVDLEWPTLVDALAAAEPDAVRSLASVLADAHFPAARAPELIVVTACLNEALTALQERVRRGQATALVAVDAPTFVGAPPTRVDPDLLRLTTAGVRVARLRCEDDLRVALSDAAWASAHA